MYKILKENAPSKNSNIEYIVDYEGKKLYLFLNDWNGEYYTDSYEFDNDEFIYKKTGLCFRPIYVEVNEDEFELLGFEKVF